MDDVQALTSIDNFFQDFSHILTKSAIERLAEVDEYEVVREVQVRHKNRLAIR